MTEINHHIPEHLIRAYVAGSLPNGFALVVASHVSMCDECRARMESEELAGGLVLESLSPTTTNDTALLSSIMEQLRTKSQGDLSQLGTVGLPNGH